MSLNDTTKPPSGWDRYRRRREIAGLPLDPRRPDRAARRWAKRAALIDTLKLERGCIDCGYCDHAAALEFDHLLDDRKTENISRMAGRNLDDLMKEIALCEVVCANCHRLRTAQRRSKTRWKPTDVELAPSNTGRGEDIRSSKLTESDVIAIRARYRPRQVTLDNLAMEFGVTKSTIWKIVKLQVWTHIP